MCRTIRKTFLTLIVAASVIAVPANASAHVRGCNTHSCDVRIHQRHHRAHQRHFIAPYRGWLWSTGGCESHHNPRAIGGGGLYRGEYQMTYHIFAAVGGRGDPAAASRLEQAYRAVKVRLAYGRGQWPVCG